MRLSFKQKIILALVCVGTLPMLAEAFINIVSSYKDTNANAARDLELSRDEILSRTQEYFAGVIGQARQLAANPTTVQALKSFENGVDTFDVGTVPVNMAKYKERFTYQQEHTPDAPADAATKWMPTDTKTQALQTLYIVNNANPIGKKHELDAAPDGSAYSQAHARYQPLFRDFLNEFGYYDIFLINTDGRIVYTVFKEIDFMDNLLTGQLKDTAFAATVAKALKSRKAGETFMGDYEPYMPSYDDGAAFIALPIMENGQTIGALAVQLPSQKINALFDNLKVYGDSTDGYFVGKDAKLRNDMRTVEKNDLLRKLKGQALDMVPTFFDDKGGIVHFKNSRDVPVVGAYKRVNVEGLDWAILVRTEMDAIYAAFYKEIARTLALVLMTILATIGLGLWLGGKLTAPVIQMGRNFNAGVDRVGRSTGLVSDAVASMIAASEETSAQSTVVRRNSEEAAGYVGSVSSAVEELNISIGDISRSIAETNVLVDDAVGKAQRTDDVVRKLGEASTRINEVVGLINDLAAQTNLLALNAAIEAARAGDAGRGFAVVADEVKKLASHTSQATIDIGAQVQEIQDVTGQSIHALQAVVEAIHRIRDNATAVSAAVEEQSGVARQISTSVRDAAQRVQQVDDNMNGIEQAANDTGVAADQVNLAVGEVQGAFTEMNGQMKVVLKDMGVKV